MVFTGNVKPQIFRQGSHFAVVREFILKFRRFLRRGKQKTRFRVFQDKGQFPGGMPGVDRDGYAAVGGDRQKGERGLDSVAKAQRHPPARPESMPAQFRADGPGTAGKFRKGKDFARMRFGDESAIRALRGVQRNYFAERILGGHTHGSYADLNTL
jgi:hypothetical protein